MNTEEMAEQARNWQNRASEMARNVGNVTDRYVHENTWTTIAVAALLGCVVGYLLAGGRDRD